jgi:hypothetical protein
MFKINLIRGQLHFVVHDQIKQDFCGCYTEFVTLACKTIIWLASGKILIKLVLL